MTRIKDNKLTKERNEIKKNDELIKSRNGHKILEISQSM